MLLSACTGEPETTTNASTDPVTTVTETDTQTAAATTEENNGKIATADFYNTHAGYWTEKENGEFIWFYEKDGQYRVSFEMWETGGPFPSGVVNEVKKAGDGLYFLLITVDEQPDDPESYGEGWKSYDYTLSITENGTEPESFDTVTPLRTEQKRFYFHTDAFNPFHGNSEGDKEAFVSAHEGYWSNENGNFFYISKEDGGRISFAVWNAGGPFPSGKITGVTDNGDGSYVVTVNIDAVPANDENDGWEASTYEFKVTDRESTPKSISAKHLYDESAHIYRFHADPEYPYL